MVLQAFWHSLWGGVPDGLNIRYLWALFFCFLAIPVRVIFGLLVYCFFRLYGSVLCIFWIFGFWPKLLRDIPIFGFLGFWLYMEGFFVLGDLGPKLQFAKVTILLFLELGAKD